MTKTEQLAENYRQQFRGPDNHISSMDIRKSYEDGAKDMLNRACEWLKQYNTGVRGEEFINEFRKTIEE